MHEVISQCMVPILLFVALAAGLHGCAPADNKSGRDNSAAPPAAGEAPRATLEVMLTREYPGETSPENVRMLLEIADGRRPGEPGTGWFGPGVSRYSWEWLAAQHEVVSDGSISPDAFLGRPEWFPSLDRNGDGAISRQDLDWSVPIPSQTPEGMSLLEAMVAGPALEPPPLDERATQTLLRAFFAGDLGSLHDGPDVDQRAPDFTLRTEGDARTVRLGELIGERPVVLVFGSLTCDTLRADYAGVEVAYRRFADDAEFLFVYVRETHPSDGWAVTPNRETGIEVPQPKTYGERAEVAAQCRTTLNVSIPIVVDEISDATAHAYSGIPNRLYVIDRDGVVVYKSGRGPAGFKPDEMEQALVMTLMEQPAAENLPEEATEPTGP